MCISTIIFQSISFFFILFFPKMNNNANNTPQVVLPRREEVNSIITSGNIMSDIPAMMVTDNLMFLIFKVHGAANIYEVNVYEPRLISIILEYYDKGFKNVKVSLL